jgi:homoserine O-acetyltransferase
MVNAQYNLLNTLVLINFFQLLEVLWVGCKFFNLLVIFLNKAKTVIPIACTSSHSAQNIAFNELGRQAIAADSNWNDGNYNH